MPLRGNEDVVQAGSVFVGPALRSGRANGASMAPLRGGIGNAKALFRFCPWSKPLLVQEAPAWPLPHGAALFFRAVSIATTRIEIPEVTVKVRNTSPKADAAVAVGQKKVAEATQ